MKQILTFLLVFNCDLLSADYLNDLVKKKSAVALLFILQECQKFEGVE